MNITKGLYDTALTKDGCGIGFVASMNEPPSHKIVQMGMEMLERLAHRGACGCDPLTGDGAGVLLQIPHDFFREFGPSTLPPFGQYGVGMVFLPADFTEAKICQDLFNRAIHEENQTLLGWRDVPVLPEQCGELSRQVMPVIRQVFIAEGNTIQNQDEFERTLYVIRKMAEHYIARANLKNASEFYVCSLSSKTIVYKGQLTPGQLRDFYTDLSDSNVKSALVMIHSRFSTNTVPSWKRAHHYRYLIHNGEINTVQGNVNWMRARENRFKTALFRDDFFKISPVIDEDGSDSSIFDNTFELLSHTGRSLPHVAMMMIPEAWQNNPLMSQAKKAFYEYHSCLMEPWDGPTSIAFTDGNVIGAILDRNGLRPSRYIVTNAGLVVLSSEVGVLDIPQKDIIKKGRLKPGHLFLLDLSKGRFVSDDEIKSEIAAKQPDQRCLADNLIAIESLPAPQSTLESISSKAPQPRGGLQQQITIQEPLIRPSDTFSPGPGRRETEGSYSEEGRKLLGLPLNLKMIALLPGSRGHEIERHMPVFMKTARRLSQQHSNLHFVIPVAKTLAMDTVRRYIPKELNNISLIDGQAVDVITSSDCVVVASGTASLECALLGKPMCIVYKASWLSYLVAMQVIKVKYLGLCNLLLNKMLAPELLQYDCNPIELTALVNQLLTDSDLVKKMSVGFKTLRVSLSEEKMDETLLNLVTRY